MFLYIKDIEIFLKFSRVYLKRVSSLCGPILVAKTYHIFLGKGLQCHCHLQNLQCMKQILCILNVPLFGITLPILLTPVPQYLNLKEI